MQRSGRAAVFTSRRGPQQRLRDAQSALAQSRLNRLNRLNNPMTLYKALGGGTD